MQRVIEAAGTDYLASVRLVDVEVKAASIVSYEDGGLESVFTAILRAKHWNTPLLRAFRHFLCRHIEFDSDPDQGHGAMIRHIGSVDRVRLL